jgi:leucyl/phenylalanyl-tRNA--protein transferase
VRAVRWLDRQGIRLVDCQVATEHLARFGAREIPRAEFLGRLAESLEQPTLRGRWEIADAGR